MTTTNLPAVRTFTGFQFGLDTPTGARVIIDNVLRGHQSDRWFVAYARRTPKSGRFGSIVLDSFTTLDEVLAFIATQEARYRRSVCPACRFQVVLADHDEDTCWELRQTRIARRAEVRSSW